MDAAVASHYSQPSERMKLARSCDDFGLRWDPSGALHGGPGGGPSRSTLLSYSGQDDSVGRGPGGARTQLPSASSVTFR